MKSSNASENISNGLKKMWDKKHRSLKEKEEYIKKLKKDNKQMIELLKDAKIHIDYIDCGCKECKRISKKLEEFFEKQLDK